MDKVEIKTEKGTVEKSAKDFGNNLMMIYSSHIGCEKVVKKHFKLPEEGQSPHALEQKLIRNCGPKAFSYKVVADLGKTTGFDLWESSKWVRLMADEKQKDKKRVEQEIAKEKKRLLSLGRQANAFTKFLIQHKTDYEKRSGKV